MADSSRTAPSIAHDIRQLFARVGIPKKGDTSAGGYQLMENGTQVRVMW
ncbi:hypothetical protein [Streptosporangium sp. 'caverna']|nr:hypothetical protein [Streptosporangium sp. 'caverna']